MSHHRVLAVVPARAGSMGLRDKNIRTFCGKPLVAHVKDVIEQVPEITHSVCSTDSAAIAKASGLDWVIRPVHLAGNHIGDVDVLQDAVARAEMMHNTTFDIILMLQPTSPLRRPNHVRDCLNRLRFENFDSVWTVTPIPLAHHPLKSLCVGPDLHMTYSCIGAELVIERQQLKQTYARNGFCYAMTRECLMCQGKTLGRNAGAVICFGDYVSIDTGSDFEYAERLWYLMHNGGA